MMAVASIVRALFDDEAAGRGPVEVVEEFVGAWIERPDKDADLAAGGDDLLAMQNRALELGVDRLLVFDHQLDLGPGRGRHIARDEFVVLDRNVDLRIGGESRYDCAGEQEDSEGKTAHLNGHYASDNRSQHNFRCESFASAILWITELRWRQGSRSGLWKRRSIAADCAITAISVGLRRQREGQNARSEDQGPQGHRLRREQGIRP